MITVFINSLTSGGAEKVVLTLLERFRHTGNMVELVLIEKKRFYDLPSGIPSSFLTNHESLEKGLLKIPYLFICAHRLKKLTKNSGQVVQSHLLRASFINVIAKVLGSKHHAQIVVHSRINFDHKPIYSRLISKWVYRQIFKRADSIISICDVMKNELDAYLQLERHPMHRTIYNPHNLFEIQKKAEMGTSGFHFSKTKKYIISVGRLVKGKRIDDLILAFSEIQNQPTEVELIILGDGELRKELEQLTHRLGIKKKVHFVGFQKNPFAYIAKSDILVLSSEWEGLPNILIESMACRTAVVSADCISGPREIINPESDISKKLVDDLEYGSYGVLYPVGAIHLLAKALQELLSDDELRTNLEKKGRERIKDFDGEKIAAQYLKTFPKGIEQLESLELKNNP